MPMDVDAAPTLLPYREDHIALTKWPVVIVVGLTILGIALAVLAVPTASKPIGALMIPAFLFAAFAVAIAWVLVYTGWVLGIEIDPDQIRYGALRKADKRTRRGLPPAKATPNASWLNEYRCPIPAIRRVWIVRGARDALDPQRATGVPTFLGSGQQRVARQGWIRTAFSPGGLMLQIDSPFATPSSNEDVWRGFALAAVNSRLWETDILYTPVANPDRCRAALAEALRLNGLELDAQGNVQKIPGAAPIARHQTVIPAPASERKRPRHGRLTTALSIVWALIPLLTLGYFAWIPYLYAALRVRQLHTTLIALLVVGADAFYWWLSGMVYGDPTVKSPPNGGAVAGVMGALALGGTFFVSSCAVRSSTSIEIPGRMIPTGWVQSRYVLRLPSI